MRKRKPKDISVLKCEYDLYIKALIQADFNRTNAAKILNVDRRTVYNKMKLFKKVGLHNTADVN